MLQQSLAWEPLFAEGDVLHKQECKSEKMLRGGYSIINFLPQAIRGFLDIYTALFVDCLGFKEGGLPRIGQW